MIVVCGSGVKTEPNTHKMKGKRRRHDPEFKARVALEAFKGVKTIQQFLDLPAGRTNIVQLCFNHGDLDSSQVSGPHQLGVPEVGEASAKRYKVLVV